MGNKQIVGDSFKTGLLFLITFYLSVGFVYAGRVYADTYDVSAKVSAEIPSQPAIITQPINNSSVISDAISVKGECPVTNPAQTVLIWRNGVFAGSTTCSATGQFTLEIQLVEGDNSLIPKLLNITNDAGLDGQPVLVRYNPLITSNPLKDKETKVNSPSNTQNNLNSNEPNEDLNFTTDRVFIVFRPNKEIELTVDIDKGAPPFVMVVDWGDGTKKTYKFDSTAKKVINHTYKTADNRIIVITVTDQSGKSKQLYLSAISTSNKSEANSEAVAGNISNNKTPYYVAGAGVVTALAVIGLTIGTVNGSISAGIPSIFQSATPKKAPRIKRVKK